MANKPTPQQERAINDRGGKLLVSAAAGSGKTKVLVDRLMRYLEDPVNPANIDDFLIITYTKAAASELRGKIAAKLNEEVALYPENRHLHRQLQRLYLTKISTVHAFCADILRENAYCLDVPADFRIAEENESIQLKMAVVDNILEYRYINEASDSDFFALVDSQGFGRNDRQLPQLVIKLYESAQCHLDPEKWLDSCLDAFDITDTSGVSESVWARYMFQDLHTFLDLHIDALSRCVDQIAGVEGMDKACGLLRSTVAQLEKLRAAHTWDDVIQNKNIDFGTLTFPRKNVDTELCAKAKAIREACKKGIQKKMRKFTEGIEQLYIDIQSNRSTINGLISLTKAFTESYRKAKRQRHILDFGDLEHGTLDLLLGKRRQGLLPLASELGDRFREVLVDEYQDTNEVQDAIFSAITEKNQNCFMVGDVKQSIYQFRLADPKIFLDKYNRYVPASDAFVGQGRKILLGKNFRSSNSIISAVNDVFSLCMSRQVGDLDYGVDEMLYEGVPKEALPEPAVEFYGIVSGENAYQDEANFVASRVAELLNGKHLINDNGTMRPIRIEDVAILLRSPGSVGHYYKNALEAIGVKCVSGNTDNLLETEEIQVIRAILQVIDNPLQDIPLLAMMMSKVFCFTADELALIRSQSLKGSIYDALKKSTTEKSKCIINTISKLRNKSRSVNLRGLMRDVFNNTKIDNVYGALADGEVRMENLHAFYKLAEDFDNGGGKSLSRFLAYLDTLDTKGVPSMASQPSGDAVTIMSIHKSKGLEFPVVFLPGLSRAFNNESAYDNMLCDKDLGIGVSCIDKYTRVRYPSITKNAISTKILSEGLSEEMRVLYVAMTRAKERLIMSYTSKRIEAEINDLALRMEFSKPELLVKEADCPGKWILLAALRRQEAGALRASIDATIPVKLFNEPWLIKLVEQTIAPSEVLQEEMPPPREEISQGMLEKLKQSLAFRYDNISATKLPSKQTATQIKGRDKDIEAADETLTNYHYINSFRRPNFVGVFVSGTTKGNAMHTVMQYLDFNLCHDADEIRHEIDRLCKDGLIDDRHKDLINVEQIAAFFATELGRKVLCGKEVIREFKFSILEDSVKFDTATKNEKVLLQGVVDCALIEDDGIIVIDFKTDHMSPKNVDEVVSRYRLQVMTYADAMERIYEKPVKEKYLYFFALNKYIAL